MTIKRSILIVAGILLATLCVYGCTSSTGCSRDGDVIAGSNQAGIPEESVDSGDPGDSASGDGIANAVPGESSGQENPEGASYEEPQSGSGDAPLDPGERDTTPEPGTQGDHASASSPSHSGSPDIETSERE